MNRGVNALVWALNARGISPTAFRLLTHLCSYVNGSDVNRDDYDVWPSKTELADKCEISVSGVKRHLKELVDAGFIEISRWQTDNGAATTNTYTICVASAHQMPAGNIVRTGKPVGVQSEPPVQTGGRGPGLDPAGFTAEPCKEPLNRTSESPPLPSEEDTPPDDDLFVSQAIEVAKPTLKEYVNLRWEKLCDDFPRTHRVRVWSDSRVKGIARRATEVVRAFGGSIDSYQVWDLMIAAIRNDVWLRGEGEPTNQYPTPFALDLDYLLRPKVFARTIERAATNELDRRATSDPRSGRSIGPSEQAARKAIERLRASSKS